MLHIKIKLDKVRREYPNIQFYLEPLGILRLCGHFAFSKEKLLEVFEAIKADNENILTGEYQVISINSQMWNAHSFLGIRAFFEEETPQENSDSIQTK